MNRMALIKKFKREYAYTKDGERCENCAFYKSGYTKLVNSLPKSISAYCKLGGFNINKFAICDAWEKKYE